MYPYEKLRAANVLATLTAVDLAATTKPKLFVFVSSTSALDTDYYVELSDSLSRDPNGHGGAESGEGLAQPGRLRPDVIEV